jgi:hypothetical protein
VEIVLMFLVLVVLLLGVGMLFAGNPDDYLNIRYPARRIDAGRIS